jgi:glutathione S-transferase
MTVALNERWPLASGVCEKGGADIVTEQQSRSRLILWGAGTARTLRAHWMLHEVGLEYESRPIGSRTGETKTVAFSELNPRQKIPLLQDGPITLAESAAIVTYLAETYGQSAGLIPPLLSAERAAYFEWCFFVMTELDAHTLYVIRKHTALAAIYSEAPNAVHAAREGFGKQVTVADRALARQGPFILGNTFTGADILLATSLDWAKRLEVSLTVTLGEYLERTTSRPPYRQAYVANQRR